MWKRGTRQGAYHNEEVELRKGATGKRLLKDKDVTEGHEGTEGKWLIREG